jgi:SAM-dependent methyltransferase
VKDFTLSCHLCGSPDLRLADQSRSSVRVTSDCRPVRTSSQLGVCLACATAQTITDEKWRIACREIYASYNTYSLANGSEAQTRAAANAQMESRSSLIVTNLRSHLERLSIKRVLDVGCGNGPFLRQLSLAFPDAHLFGMEFDSANQAILGQIAGFQRLFSGGLKTVEGKFDVISLIHVLEHLENPASWLSELLKHAGQSARLFVQVPDCSVNAFALMIADHATHFCPSTLLRCVKAAGWAPLDAGPYWIAKELSLLAANSRSESVGFELADSSEVNREIERLNSSLRWLESVVDDAKTFARGHKKFGIFGTAIAATWLAQRLRDDGIENFFFVDEQMERVGRKHLGVSVFSPSEAPEDVPVFVCLAPVQADEVVSRMNRSGFPRYVRPSCEV